MGCPFAIWLTANRDGTKLVVTKIVNNHNHEIRRLVTSFCSVFTRES